MSKELIRELLGIIERETGATITLATPAKDLSAVPEVLQPLYSLSDGLGLPFGDVYSVAEFHNEGFPTGWLCFGADKYFSFYLCHVSSNPSVTTWDHESGTEVEGVWHSAVDWLVAEYRDYIEDRLRFSRLCVTEIPAGIAKNLILRHLKPLSSKSSPEWLELLRAGAFAIDNISRLDAITTVRALQTMGISCHVDCQSE